MDFKRNMALKIVVLITTVVGLFAAFLKFETAAIQVAPAPDPAPWTQSADPGQPYGNSSGGSSGGYSGGYSGYSSGGSSSGGYSGSSSSDGPFYNQDGQRVDRSGQVCGGYNPAQECYP